MTSSFVVDSESVSLFDLDRIRTRVEWGLCCINQTLRHPSKEIPKSKRPPEIFPNRTCTRDRYTVEKAKALALQNIQDIPSILRWNDANGICHYRISSDMLPHYTDPETETYTLDFALEAFREVGHVASQLGHQLTAHPGQFVQIGAKDAQVFQKSVEELQMHADMLRAMEIPATTGILCIHGGGVYGDKEATKRRWIDQFDDLPREIQSRIAIEHCEKCYSLPDVLELAEATHIPVIYDNLHYMCYQHLHPHESHGSPIDWMPQVIETWTDRGTHPVMHLAEQKPDSKIGAHADYVSRLPPEMLWVLREYEDLPIHIEVEAKQKELAILRLQQKYNVV